jgi:hypothetical protein
VRRIGSTIVSPCFEPVDAGDQTEDFALFPARSAVSFIELGDQSGAIVLLRSRSMRRVGRRVGEHAFESIEGRAFRL